MPVARPRRCGTARRVVGIAHHLEPRGGHRLVERVEIQIREQRTDDRPLGRPRLGRRLLQPFENRLLQKRVEQCEHTSIGHLRFDPCTQRRARNRIEIRLKVRVHNMDVVRTQQGRDPAQRIFRAPSRSKPITVRGEVPFVDRFQYQAEGRLHDAISHRWNPERAAFLRARFGNPVPPNRVRPVGPGAQRVGQRGQMRVESLGKHRDCHMVDTRRAPIGLDSRKGRSQRR